MLHSIRLAPALLLLAAFYRVALSQPYGGSAPPGDEDSGTVVSLPELRAQGTWPSPDTGFLGQPLSLARLGRAELERGTGLYLKEAVNANVPGVLMTTRATASGQAFNIRGYGNGARGTNGINSNFDGQGAKVYLNGIPLTDAEGVTVLDDVDFGSIGEVEILKGPMGSLHGLAIAGVIKLKTPRPERGVTLGQDALAGSHGLSRLSTRLRARTENSSLLANYGRQAYDGFMPHTASEKDFVNVAGEFQLDSRRSLSAYFGHADSYDQRNGEITIGQWDSVDYAGNPAYIKNDAHSHVVSFRAGVGHTYAFNRYVSNTTSVFGSGVGNDASSGGGWTDKRPVNYGFRSAVDLDLSLRGGFGLSGSAGVEAQRQEAQVIGYPMVTDSSNPAGYNILGAARSNQFYVAKTASLFTEWVLAMPHDISLTAGLGLSLMVIDLRDRFFVAANNKPARDVPLRFQASYDEMISPHLAVNKRFFGRQMSVYAAYSRGFKAPTASFIFVPATGRLNTGLEPEVGDQVEVGAKGSLFNHRLDCNLAVFDAMFSKKMTAIAVPLNPPAVGTAYSYMANGGRQDHRGVEGVVKWNAYRSDDGVLRRVQPFANFAYSDFKYEDFRFETLTNKASSPSSARDSVKVADYSGNPVAGVPRLAANAGLDLALIFGLYANAVYSYRNKTPFTSDVRDVEADTSGHVAAAYGLLNAKVGLRRRLWNRVDAEVFAGAENLTGERYYYTLFLNQLPDAYIPAPEKTTWYGGLSAGYRF